MLAHGAFADTHSIYLVDFDGHGQSSLAGPITIDSLSRDVFELMDALDIQQASLVGHSMSGVSTTSSNISYLCL